jgi:hypothetical protein
VLRLALALTLLLAAPVHAATVSYDPGGPPSARDGDDFLHGGPGADVVDGGAGTDQLDYLGYTQPVVVDLSRSLQPDGDILTVKPDSEFCRARVSVVARGLTLGALVVPLKGRTWHRSSIPLSRPARDVQVVSRASCGRLGSVTQFRLRA